MYVKLSSSQAYQTGYRITGAIWQRLWICHNLLATRQKYLSRTQNFLLLPIVWVLILGCPYIVMPDLLLKIIPSSDSIAPFFRLSTYLNLNRMRLVTRYLHCSFTSTWHWLRRKTIITYNVSNHLESMKCSRPSSRRL